MRRQQPYQPESPLSLSQSAARMMTYLAMPLVFAQTPAKDHLPSVSSTGPSDHSSPWAIKMKKKLTKKVRKRAKRNSKKRAMVRKYKNRRGESKVCLAYELAPTMCWRSNTRCTVCWLVQSLLRRPTGFGMQP
ncbi:unnamed protein product [Cladocopium goreaui]|uniref:Uncharacterized protein n=1 Tax=Cladocopium goreaui TaxID=2562237 RepID=A0A9P1FGF6_9DINO|nr:unnamed protein product [Cladocopium goreaui]